MPQVTHVTTRRGFVAAAGFGGVSLYGLWAAYGAAPGPLALLGLDGRHGEPQPADVVAAAGKTDAVVGQGAHSGHGAAPAGQGAAEFSRMTDEFIARYRLPDGSVHPRRLAVGGAGDRARDVRLLSRRFRADAGLAGIGQRHRRRPLSPKE